jgi:HK97 family phage major capsid protein
MSKLDEARGIVTASQRIVEDAQRSGRELSAAEVKSIEQNLSRASQLEVAHRVDEFGSDLGAQATPVETYQGPGDVFVASQGYKSIRHADSRPQQWSTGPVEVKGFQGAHYKGTLLESNSDGPGGGPTPAWYQPGIAPKLIEYAGLAAFFGTSQTPGSQVRYVVEGTATNSATGVAEGGVKPESTIDVGEVVEPVKKLATVLPISDEMLEDAPAIKAYLNDRLTFFVRLEEERQLLRGAGGNDLIGLMNRTGGQAINQYTRSRPTTTRRRC